MSRKNRKSAISEDTKSQLRFLNLQYMIDILDEFEADTNWQILSFDEKFEMLVNRMFQEKNSERIHRLKRGAKLRYPFASIVGIRYSDERDLDRKKMMELGTCSFLRNETNLIFEGPAGCGKTHLSNCIANAACERGFRSFYVRFPDLIQQYEEIKDTASAIRKFIRKYASYQLLIIDEWLMIPKITNEIKSLLFEIMEIRHTESSTIFCTQLKLEEWHDRLGGDIHADSLLDRIIHNQIRVQIGNNNMRASKNRERKKS